MTARLPELRKDQRYHAALPVSLEKATGITRDISTSGVYFWNDSICMWRPGHSISFAIELEMASERILWKCTGTVVRTERFGDMVGVAATVSEWTMESLSTNVHQ